VKNKKALRVDLDELCQAMEDSSYEHDYYLNLDNGEILFLSEYMTKGVVNSPSPLL